MKIIKMIMFMEYMFKQKYIRVETFLSFDYALFEVFIVLRCLQLSDIKKATCNKI